MQVAEKSFEKVEFGEEESDDGGIPSEYRGTASDRKDMTTLGKKQVLRRNFRFITMLGFASTAMATWEILLPLFTFVLTDGGTGDLFWGFIAAGIGMSLVYASIAEMASMCPTSGGQYHWVSEFAPPKIQKFLSYIVGWLCAIAWQVYLGGACFMVGTIIQGLIVLNLEDYVWKNYHGTLLTIAVISFAVLFNTALASRLPLIESICLVLHTVGFFAIVIPLWVMGSHSDAHVLLDFTNYGGWPSTGLSAMIGLTSPISVLTGFDCSVHMSEEIQDASITLPRAIMWSVVPNTALGFIMAITLIFTLGDIDNILATATGQPFIQVFFNATQSLAATNAMTAIVVVLLICCGISELATSSRQIWSFARDRGLPASDWLSKVTPGWNIPLRAVCVSLVVTTLLACINLGSSTALNAINSLGGVSILGSYFITISCLIWRRAFGRPLPPRRWSLGKFGMGINICAILFLAPVWFFAFWPLAIPVNPTNMNWSSTMFGSIISIALVDYFVQARHQYVGPVVQVIRDE
ncbi:amino acid transporter-like protein [Mollisia scopiformis]|uniref:Amino acid transporter-like protein n=1 Tax=Mollisia scopiformis TaxID=149040 RepID=A0A194WZM2_MOLSC|nr:amino acid transporter-like protein [Mollisia scopiformis]KUJ13159.1 amino acid transporter-like protein [Mollisia scopiformis]